MKFTVERSALQPIADAVCPIAKSKTIPILDTVLIEAGEALSMTATDMDMEVSASCDASVVERGAACVDASVLRTFISSLPAGAQVSAEMAGGKLAFRAGRARCALACLPPEDFPRFAERGTVATRFAIPAKSLVSMIARTSHAICTEQTRYYLCGVALVVSRDPRTLRAIATNGHILARATIDMPSGAEDMPTIIVPDYAVAALRKLSSGHDGDVSIECSESVIRATIGGMRFASKLIDGTYPDTDRVIPQRAGDPIRVARTVLSDAISRVVAVVDQSKADKTRVLRFDFAGSVLTITGSGDVGQIDEAIDIQGDGSPIEVGINSRYIRDSINAVGGDFVDLYIADPCAPILILNPEGAADDAAVVMPMRI